MLEIKKKQRWLFDNSNKICKDRTHYKSKVIFEITHVFSPTSKISQGCLAKGKVVQSFIDRVFRKHPEWYFDENELNNKECKCYQYLNGQDRV